MTASLAESVQRVGPLEIVEVEYREPVLALSGSSWGLTAMCPWRVVREGGIELSWSTPDAEDRVWDLIGRRVVAAVPQGRDAAFTLSDGSVLEVFSDSDVDPWVLRLPDIVFVGPLHEAT
jgi:hypothetical protein